MSEAPVAPPEASSAPAPRRPGWPVRILRGLLAAVIGLVVVVLALVGWLGATRSGLEQVVDFAERLSGGRVTIERPEGYLLGQLRLGALHVRTPTLHVDVADLVLDWRPGAFPGSGLDVAALTAADVRVATAPSTEPTVMPASLALPAAVHVGHFQIDRLRIGKLEGGEPAAPDLELTRLAGRLDSDGRQHRLEALRVSAPFGQLAGRLALDGRQPFPLTARAILTTHQAGEAYTVAAGAAGDLASFALDAHASGAGVDGRARAVATPFAPLPVASARIELRGVDPQRFHAAAPKARLDIDVALEPGPGAGEGVAGWVVSGPVRLVNHQPGPYDSGALPLESLSAALRWADGELAVSQLDLRLPGQGRARGEVRWRAPLAADSEGFGRVDGELAIAGLDARRLDGRAVITSIAGRLAASADAAGQRFSADLRDPRLALRLKGQHADGELVLDEVFAQARQARLEARARLALAGDGRFEVGGSLSRFDPRAFVASAPPADLNARFNATGRRAPRLAARLKLELAPSTLEGKPLAGKAALEVDGSRLVDADVALDLAGNQLFAKGRYGRPGDGLDVNLDAPRLAALGHGLGGRLRLDGVLRGSPAQPTGEFELAGDKLRFGSLLLDAIKGRGRLAEGRHGALGLALDLEGLRGGGDEALVRRASLRIDGSRAANTTRLELAGPGKATLALNLVGALADGLRWDGQLAGLEVGGDYPLRLLAPAPLQLSPELVRLGRAELRGGGGGLYRLDETRWQPRRIVARGSVSGAQVGLILDPATRAVKSRGDSLQIGGEWDVDITEQVNGVVRLFREKGDLTLQGDSPVRLGLDDLQLTLTAASNRLAFGFSARGSQLGSASGAGTALAERSPDGALRLVPGAPLLGSARIDIPSIAWAGPLADQNLKTDGSLKGEFTLAGTPARPEAAGRLRGDGLSFVMADQGLHLSGGTLVADFNRDRLNLDELSFVSPNRVKPDEKRIALARLTATPGTLKVRGGIQLASGDGRFEYRAERLPLLQRTDQWLVLSGEGEVLSGWNFANLKGRFSADAGFVGLAHTPPPSLGADVVVIDPAKAAKPAASPFQMYTDLTVNLGDALYVRALGLDTRLAGELSLVSGPGRPLEATGSIRTVGGVFEGYGQRLSIERGIITFNGPLANPGLNVVALRKGLAVEAGVGIGGTARRPVVRLVSEPNVPDPEKLGWIVLGRPPDQGSGGEMGLLLPAAQALLGDTGGGLPANIAKSLGFDEFSFGSSIDPRSRVQTSSVASSSVTGASSASSSQAATMPGQVVTIGKRLSARAQLSFEQSIGGTSSVIKLTYLLTRRLSVIGRAGSENALDLLFSLSFR